MNDRLVIFLEYNSKTFTTNRKYVTRNTINGIYENNLIRYKHYMPVCVLFLFELCDPTIMWTISNRVKHFREHLQ
jgi:hypothetical protein